MTELTSELQRMADDAARQARPPAVADIIRKGDRRRRHFLGGLSAAGVVGVGVALALAMTGPAPAHGTGTGTIRTAAFTLVSNADGTATLTINPVVLVEPGPLQRDLARDGIPAVVTVGSFCHSDPEPAGLNRVMPAPGRPEPHPRRAELATVTINPAAMPPGTELSFGNFRLKNEVRTYFALIDTRSYTCTSGPAIPSPPGGAAWIVDVRTAAL